MDLIHHFHNKKVVAFGNTKGRYYKLNPSVNYTKNFELTNEISTDTILKEKQIARQEKTTKRNWIKTTPRIGNEELQNWRD